MQSKIGSFHLMYTLTQYGLEFPRGFGKTVSEGLCALASFDLLWGFFDE